MTRKILIFIIILSATCASSNFMKEEKPVLWFGTGHRIYAGIDHYRLVYEFHDPCDLLNASLVSNKTQMDEPMMEALEVAHETCERIYKDKFLDLKDSLATRIIRRRMKRASHHFDYILESGAQAIAGQTFGFFGSNFVQTLWEIFDPSSKTNRLSRIEENQEAMREALIKEAENADVLNVAYEKTGKQLSLLDFKLTSLEQSVRRSMTFAQHVESLTNYIIMQITDRSKNLQRLMDGYMEDKSVAIRDMSDLLHYNDLENIKQQDTYFTRLDWMGFQITFEFLVKRTDKKIRLLKVVDFSIWTNLTQQNPHLNTYKGARFIVHNSTSNCVKAAPKAELTALSECDTNNYFDPDLDKWEVAHGDPWTTSPSNSSYHMTYQNLYIYCFPHQVTINSTVYDCPNYVSSVTTDNNVSIPGAFSFQPKKYLQHFIYDQKGSPFKSNLTERYSDRKEIINNAALSRFMARNSTGFFTSITIPPLLRETWYDYLYIYMFLTTLSILAFFLSYKYFAGLITYYA